MQPSWPSLNFSVVAIQQESQQLLVILNMSLLACHEISKYCLCSTVYRSCLLAEPYVIELMIFL